METVDWVAGISTFVSLVPLAGLPGLLVLTAASPVLELIYWGRFRRAVKRMTDGVWGVALLLTLIWTPALPTVWRFIDRWKPGLPFGRHLGWACLGMWAWAVIATFVLSELIIKPRQR
jgi:hypothetical protein